jgi:hypothetical protein
MQWWVVAIAILLLLWMTVRERYVDVPGPGTRPSLTDPGWRSKIEAQAPIGGSKEDYEKALRMFYDDIYKPMRTANSGAAPKDTQVEEFIKVQPSTIDKGALRQIILSGFAVDRTTSAAAREEKQVKFSPSEALEPRDGVLETWKRVEETYIPVDTRIGDLPEGVYAPTEQQETPRREGIVDDKSTSWTGQKPYSIAQNVS